MCRDSVFYIDKKNLKHKIKFFVFNISKSYTSLLYIVLNEIFNDTFHFDTPWFCFPSSRIINHKWEIKYIIEMRNEQYIIFGFQD